MNVVLCLWDVVWLLLISNICLVMADWPAPCSLDCCAVEQEEHTSGTVLNLATWHEGRFPKHLRRRRAYFLRAESRFDGSSAEVRTTVRGYTYGAVVNHPRLLAGPVQFKREALLCLRAIKAQQDVSLLVQRRFRAHLNLSRRCADNILAAALFSFRSTHAEVALLERDPLKAACATESSGRSCLACKNAGRPSLIHVAYHRKCSSRDFVHLSITDFSPSLGAPVFLVGLRNFAQNLSLSAVAAMAPLML